MPIFENSGQCAANSVPIAVSQSGQATLPSAALGLIVKPSGRVTLRGADLRRRRVVGLWVCGTLRSMSRPEAVSARSVVGFADRLGLKLSWLQPVVAGYGVGRCRLRSRRSIRCRPSPSAARRRWSGSAGTALPGSTISRRSG